VRAAGVNFADSLMVGGTYQVKPPFPFTPGLEAAGEVIETDSEVIGLPTGQRVLAVLRNGGGYAKEIVLDAATVVPISRDDGFRDCRGVPGGLRHLVFCADASRPSAVGRNALGAGRGRRSRA
jgi:NADPH2:quinone reductase